MKQTFLTAIISFAVIALLAGAGYLLIQQAASQGDRPETDRNEQEETKEKTETPEASSENIPEEMNEARLQFYLHEMTHSKVYAEDKWGAARPMTQETIEELLSIVEASTFDEKAFYRNTLEDWQEGDFSGAVDVHNTIWHWHRGSVGKATRLMTDEEERAYIQKNF